MIRKIFIPMSGLSPKQDYRVAYLFELTIVGRMYENLLFNLLKQYSSSRDDFFSVKSFHFRYKA